MSDEPYQSFDVRQKIELSNEVQRKAEFLSYDLVKRTEEEEEDRRVKLQMS